MDRSPEPTRDRPGCLGDATLGLGVLVVLAALVALGGLLGLVILAVMAALAAIFG